MLNAWDINTSGELALVVMAVCAVPMAIVALGMVIAYLHDWRRR